MSDKSKIQAYAARLLEELMSEISEDHYCAGWMGDLEYELWRMVRGGDRHYGMGKVAEDQIGLLRQYAEDADGWQTCQGFMPMQQWLKHFADFEAWHQPMIAELETAPESRGLAIVRRYAPNKPVNPLDGRKFP